MQIIGSVLRGGSACAWLGLAVSYQGPGWPATITALSGPLGSYPCSPGRSAIRTKHPILPPGHVTGPVYQVHTAAVAAHRARTARRKQATAAA